MSTITLMSAWVCPPCEVGGTDPVSAPSCWNCGGHVVITARTAHLQLFRGLPAGWPDVAAHPTRRSTALCTAPYYCSAAGPGRLTRAAGRAGRRRGPRRPRAPVPGAPGRLRHRRCWWLAADTCHGRLAHVSGIVTGDLVRVGYGITTGDTTLINPGGPDAAELPLQYQENVTGPRKQAASLR